jgi:redox-sensitive bicupin YhaK (pirin superfamily)
MTAGSGIRHSEFNPSTTEPVHLLQIWIQPEKAALPPSYEQKSFPEAEKQGKLRVVASRDTSDGSVKINQDAKLFVTLLKPGEEVTHELAQGRHAWLQVARGAVQVNSEQLDQGDGAAISDENKIAIKGVQDAEILLFDLA